MFFGGIVSALCQQNGIPSMASNRVTAIVNTRCHFLNLGTGSFAHSKCFVTCPSTLNTEFNIYFWISFSASNDQMPLVLTLFSFVPDPSRVVACRITARAECVNKFELFRGPFVEFLFLFSSNFDFQVALLSTHRHLPPPVK